MQNDADRYAEFRTYSWAFDELHEADERDVSDVIIEHYGLVGTDVAADRIWPLRDYPQHGPDADEPGLAVYAPLLNTTLARASEDGVRCMMVGARGDEVVGDWVYDDWGMFRALAWRELARALRAREGSVMLGLMRRARSRARRILMRGTTGQESKSFPGWVDATFAARVDLPTIIQGTPDVYDRGAAPRQQRVQRMFSFAGARLARMAERRHAYHSLALLDPWSDRRLIEFVAATPAWIVNRPHSPKHIAREAMRGVMPEAVRGRAGKTIPRALYDRGLKIEQRHVVEDLIERSVAADRGFVVRDRLRADYDAYRAGRPTVHDFWWPLTLELWLRSHHSRDGCTW